MTVRSKISDPLPRPGPAVSRGATESALGMGPSPLFLHVCPSFEVGGLQDRLVAIVNHLGPAARHAIVALDGNYACARRLDRSVRVETPEVTWAGAGSLGSVLHGYHALRTWRPDLFLTYNWASLEWAAASLFHHPCPHIHHEDGFGPEESDVQLRRRVLFRRLALLRSSAVIVPSQSLYRLARRTWHVSYGILHHIPNGIDCSRFRTTGRETASATDGKALVLGSLAPLRPEKGLDVLLRVAADLSRHHELRLVIAGNGPEKQSLETLAHELGLGACTAFLGQVDEPGAVLSGFDLFVMTSKTEQMPFSLLQAMAAGRAVAAFDVGDIKEMVAVENRPFVVAPGDCRALQQAMHRLLADRGLRREIGAANARKVADAYPQSAMLAAHEGLYETLLGRPLRGTTGV